MLIIKGKHKGQEVEISQWCNDWFSTRCGKILTPTQIELTDKEKEDVIKHDNNGLLFGLYKFNGNRFKKIKRRIASY